MNRFALARPRTSEEALGLLSGGDYRLPVLKGSGLDLLDQMKEGLIQPDLLVDVRGLRREHPIRPTKEGGLLIDPTVTLAELAASDLVQRLAPVLAQAAGSAASPQVRNVATAAGNLMQRPRCWYFRHEEFDCLKKNGHECFAVDGENEFHAIFSDGPCYIVHPSNIAPAMMVANGRVHIEGGRQPRTLFMDEFFHDPARGLRDETELLPGEIIVGLEVENAPASGFAVVKAKQSFDWPLVFATARLTLDGAAIRKADVAAGAVAPVPWPLPMVAKALVGVSVDDLAGLEKACAKSIDGAKPMRDNTYKLKLLPVVVKRAVLQAAGREVPA